MANKGYVMMQQRMIVFLHRSEPLIASWIVLDETGKIIQAVSEAPLTAGIKNTEVLIIVPTEEVLLTQVSLPKMNRQRLMQALPFALEEQLIDDVEKLHFAIGEYQANHAFPVAIVAKQKMDAWIAALKAIEISPAAIFPSVFILPVAEKAWFINSYAGVSTTRTGKFTGFACDEANLAELLKLKMAEEKEEIETVSSDYSHLQLLEKYATDISDEPPINLLQSPYRSKRKATNTKRIWTLAGVLMCAWIILLLFSNIGSLIILHLQVKKIDNDIFQIYKRNFPQATSLVAPRERMQDKLKSTFAQANKNNFLALLALIGKSLSDNKEIHLQNLDFRDKQLTLDLIAGSFDSLDAFTEAMTQQGLNVKRQNAAIVGTTVKATLQISAGEA
jgi:general secretion pathway protein L